MQIVVSGDAASWTAREEHATGPYEARYERASDGAIRKRKLRYIQAILKRWETEGKNDRFAPKPEPNTEEERRRKYIPDEFSDIILG